MSVLRSKQVSPILDRQRLQRRVGWVALLSGSLRDNTTIHLSLIGFAILVIYSNALTGPFLFDDATLVTDPKYMPTQLTDFTDSLADDRPLGVLSFALNHYFSGPDVRAYHATNIAIHFFASLAMYLLLRDLLRLPALGAQYGQRATLIAFLASLLFAVHPVHTQAVSYVVQRLTSLMTLFYLLALWCFLRGRMSDNRRSALALYLAAIVLGSASVLTKQNAITLPVFALLCEIALIKRAMPSRSALLLNAALIVVLLAGGIAFFTDVDLGSWFKEHYRFLNCTLAERVLTESRVVLYYISLFAYPAPSRLCLEYDFPISAGLFTPPVTALAVATVVAAIGWAATSIYRHPLVSFAILWYFGQLVLESTVIPLELVFEHRMYLPDIALLLLVSVGAALALRTQWRPILVSGLCVLVLVWGRWTYIRNNTWSSEAALYRDCAIKTPTKGRTNYNYALILARQGDKEQAVQRLKTGLFYEPSYLHSYGLLGRLLVQLGQGDEARTFLIVALQARPDDFVSRHALAVACLQGGMVAESVSQTRILLSVLSDLDDPAMWRAFIRANESCPLPGDKLVYAAVRHRLDPDDSDLQCLFAWELSEASLHQDAEEQCRGAVLREKGGRGTGDLLEIILARRALTEDRPAEALVHLERTGVEVRHARTTVLLEAILRFRLAQYSAAQKSLETGIDLRYCGQKVAQFHALLLGLTGDIAEAKTSLQVSQHQQPVEWGGYLEALLERVVRPCEMVPQLGWEAVLTEMTKASNEEEVRGGGNAQTGNPESAASR